jgi:hypothetical protein
MVDKIDPAIFIIYSLGQYLINKIGLNTNLEFDETNLNGS